MGCSAPPQYESDPENPTSAVGFFAIGDPILLERAAAGDHGFSNAKQQANACDVSFKSKRGLAARWDILGTVTLIPGLLTMGQWWMIFLSLRLPWWGSHSPLAVLFHDARAPYPRLAFLPSSRPTIRKPSCSGTSCGRKVSGLEIIKGRIAEFGNRSVAAVEVPIDIESVILGYQGIMRYCEGFPATKCCRKLGERQRRSHRSCRSWRRVLEVRHTRERKSIG